MKRFTTVWQTLLTLGLLLLTLQGQAAPVVQFIHTDALGSPIAATGDQGQLLWREEYQPFGERTINDSASVSRKSWYTGHIEDQDTGLIYMGARFYDPQIGRFLSIDPVGFSNDNPMQFNRYAYANNNPYKYVDPDGRSPVLGLFVGGALILGFSDYANAPALGEQGISKSLLEKVLTVVGAGAVVRARSGLTGVASAGDDVAKGIAGVPGRVQSRINLSNDGIEHTVSRHLNPARAGNKSQFTLPESELRSLLGAKSTVQAPAKALETGNFARTITTNRTVGNLAEKMGGGSTNTFTVITDKFGNLQTAFAGGL